MKIDPLGNLKRKEKQRASRRRELLTSIAILLVLLVLLAYGWRMSNACDGDLVVGVFRLVCIPS